MNNTVKRIIEKYKEIIMYLIFGVATTIVNFGIYSTIVVILKSSSSLSIAAYVAVANVVAWVCATFFAYITNKLYVFHTHNWQLQYIIREAGMFFTTRGLTGVFELIAVPALYYIGMKQAVFGIDGFVAKAIISIIVVIFNYVFSKLLIFKNQASKIDNE